MKIPKRVDMETRRGEGRWFGWGRGERGEKFAHWVSDSKVERERGEEIVTSSKSEQVSEIRKQKERRLRYNESEWS